MSKLRGCYWVTQEGVFIVILAIYIYAPNDDGDRHLLCEKFFEVPKKY